MSAIWVLLELVPLAVLALLACAAGFADQREEVEPEWWADFEREFGLYVARSAPERK
ncbi:MAG: hypothetical protein ACTHQQ_04200 [Solirubrobacteraceae bacterium]